MITSSIMIFTMASSFCYAYWINPFLRSDDFCVERQCREPPTIPVTLYLVVKATSPLYVSVLPKKCENENIDNVCYTFFDLGAGFLLAYQSVVYCDDSYVLYSHIEVDIPGRLGILRGADPTCMYQEYVLQLGCDLNFLVYRCFMFGKCDQDVVTLDPGYDSVYAVGTVNKPTPTCQEILIKQIQETVGFNVTEHVALPNKLDNKCVASFNGARCIGFEKLDEKDSTSVNTQEDTMAGHFKRELDEILGKIKDGSGLS